MPTCDNKNMILIENVKNNIEKQKQPKISTKRKTVNQIVKKSIQNGKKGMRFQLTPCEKWWRDDG